MSEGVWWSNWCVLWAMPPPDPSRAAGYDGSTSPHPPSLFELRRTRGEVELRIAIWVIDRERG